MASAGEEALALALEFSRARTLGLGLAVSRSVGLRCRAAIANSTHVEALVCTSSDVGKLVEEIGSSLRLQCPLGGLLLLHTKFRRSKDKVRSVVGRMRDDGLVQRSIPTFRAPVHGVLGRTSEGRPAELKADRVCLLVVALPRSMARLRAMDVKLLDRFTRNSNMARDGVLGLSLFLNYPGNVAESLEEGMTLPPCVGGGILDGRADQIQPSGDCSTINSLVIEWLASSRPGPGTISAVHTQTMANSRVQRRELPRPGQQENAGLRRARELIAEQREAVLGDSAKGIRAADEDAAPDSATETSRTASRWWPKAVVAFACDSRGGDPWYGEPCAETALLHEAYTESSEGPAPALFGIFCGGEVGPAIADTSDESDSSDESPRPRGDCHAHLSTAENFDVAHPGSAPGAAGSVGGLVAPDATAEDEEESSAPTTPEDANDGLRSKIRSFSTVVSVIA